MRLKISGCEATAASKIQALASDPTTLDGKNVHLAIFDEVQDYRDYGFISRLKKKTVKRRQPPQLLRNC